MSAVYLIVGLVAMLGGCGSVAAIGLPLFRLNEGDWPWGTNHLVIDIWGLCFIYGTVTILVVGSLGTMAVFIGSRIMERQ